MCDLEWARLFSLKSNYLGLEADLVEKVEDSLVGDLNEKLFNDLSDAGKK